jgi:hypothetical protein
LNIPGAITEFCSAEEAFKESVKSIDAWRYGCDLGVKESEVMSFADDYIAKARTLHDFRACLIDMNKDKDVMAKADVLKAKRGWRYQKQKLTKLLQKSQVPDALAKACSALYSSGEGVTAHLASTPYTSEFTGGLSNPVAFSLGLNSEEGPTRLHKAFATWYDENQSIVKAKVAKNITSLKSRRNRRSPSVEMGLLLGRTVTIARSQLCLCPRSSSSCKTTRSTRASSVGPSQALRSFCK